jgi:hypothetical protein
MPIILIFARSTFMYMESGNVIRTEREGESLMIVWKLASSRAEIHSLICPKPGIPDAQIKPDMPITSIKNDAGVVVLVILDGKQYLNNLPEFTA